MVHLDQKRRDFVKPQAKKKKIQVETGKSITATDIQPQPATSSFEKPKHQKKRVKPIADKKKSPKKTPRKKDLDNSTSGDDDDA